jgi:hypothetical protein
MYRQSPNNKKVFNSHGEIEEENKNFLLILFDIGDNIAEPEYLFQNIKIIPELPLQNFPEKY